MTVVRIHTIATVMLKFLLFHVYIHQILSINSEFLNEERIIGGSGGGVGGDIDVVVGGGCDSGGGGWGCGDGDSGGGGVGNIGKTDYEYFSRVRTGTKRVRSIVCALVGER